MVVSFGDVLGNIVVGGLFGLLILAILWPTRRSAVRLLTRWGVPDPTEAEMAQSLTYLRRRRFWYPWLYMGLPLVIDSAGLLPANQNSVWSIPAILLLGALLAELFAQRRSPAPVRVAVPVRRTLTDLVPAWALVLNTVAALGALLLLVGALSGIGWARNWYPHWTTHILLIALSSAILTVLVVWIVVGLALRRPSVAELRIDPILRARSARVPVGLGTATLCALMAGGESAFRGWIIVFAGLFLWSAIAGPVRRPVPVPA